MKAYFEKPEMVVREFGVEDVIKTSGGVGTYSGKTEEELRSDGYDVHETAWSDFFGS